MVTDAFDYIIVGAGSAGCVLANRLSANPAHRVLLIEAGGEDRHPMIPIPIGIGKTLYDPSLCWYYPTEAEPGNAGEPRMFMRGRVIGGSSSVNGMVYCRGQPEDYDGWGDLGCTGWGWSDMAEAFRAAGVPAPAEAVVATAEQAHDVAASGRLGWPLVVKPAEQAPHRHVRDLSGR